MIVTSLGFQVGQMGFQGMKQLNRIQSIVFDAAYNTNENLLICAPTGAGKTNVAMLTILREIKQNIEEGVIKKDKFKVKFFAAKAWYIHTSSQSLGGMPASMSFDRVAWRLSWRICILLLVG